MEDLVRITSKAARLALSGWNPAAPDARDRLADAIGQAVAAGIQRHEESNARHIAMTMAGLEEDEESQVDWQV